MTASPRPLIGLTATVYDHPTKHIAMAALNHSYAEAVLAAGGIPLLIPAITPPEEATALLERLDGVLLTGGGDIDPIHYHGQEHPAVHNVIAARDAIELALGRLAVARKVPVLGICRGIQVLNVAMGGTLYEDVPSQYGESVRHPRDNTTERALLAHRVRVAPESRLAALLGTTSLEVNSLHHQAVQALAPGLRAVAWAEDGLIEGAEIPDHPFAVAVQWHPEVLFADHPPHAGLFRGLIEAARQKV